MLSKQTKSLAILLIAALISGAVGSWYHAHDRSKAASALTFTLAGTHPQAAAQPTTTGKTLARLVAFNGKIYAGFGDYTANTGPIAVNPYNPSTGTFTDSLLNSPTEAILNFRIINGKLYAPDIDPIAGESSGGYAIGEPWSHKAPVRAIHMFDVATYTGSDLWMVGASGSNATAWRSTDGGATWTVAQTDAPISSTDYARYYWVAALDGKLYLQARMLNTGEVKPAKIFDGTNWTTGTSQALAYGDSRTPVVFQHKIITAASGLSAYTGSGDPSMISSFRVASGYQAARDFYIDGSYFYVLCYNQEVFRSADLTNWEDLGKAPASSVSIAVLNNQVYVGTTDAQLYHSSTIGTTAPPADTTKPSVSLTVPSNGQTLSGTVSLTATASDNVAVSAVSFLIDGNVLTTDSTSPYTAVWDTTKIADGSHSVAAQAKDSAGNIQKSVTASVTVHNQQKTLVPAPTPPPPAEEPTPSPPQPSSDPVVVPAAAGGTASNNAEPTVTGHVSVQAPTVVPDASGKTSATVRVEYYIDDRLVQTIASPPFTAQIDTTNLPDGTHILKIRSYNTQGAYHDSFKKIIVDNHKGLSRTALLAGAGGFSLLTIGGGFWQRSRLVQLLRRLFNRPPPPPPAGTFTGYVGHF